MRYKENAFRSREYSRGYGYGFVYIFKNTQANSVKIGMTKNPLLDRLIALNKYKPNPLYVWEYQQAYETKNYEEVEKLSHKYLEDYIDKDAHIGEVFNCSLEKAIDVVEDVLRELKLFDEAIKIGDENPYSKPEGVK